MQPSAWTQRTFGRVVCRRLWLQEDEKVSEPKPVPAATPREAEAVVTIAQRFARVPETGIEPIDELLRDFTPHAKEAGKEALGRAACLIRHGDRSTMLTILGAVAVAGWVMARTDWAPPLVSLNTSIKIATFARRCVRASARRGTIIFTAHCETDTPTPRRGCDERKDPERTVSRYAEGYLLR
jgi:hypothetical protein